ncbi:chromate transporter [Hydrogenophaga crassostreae]|uniref:Chromate transporter n=1 Tax=Hydrogenophaga crassostreae TaxID=1763535 RepID=A0A167I424_9BURK|nr:chromate transporter [Hydrogenophaga crassostreae]AOW13291.1 chromate transporter [Hydrogenophaga crassostreae]OAD42113.1 chromate transporter [Hydrogenophaga crassostreae]
MNMLPTLSNWVELFNHFASLSLLAIGGAITTAPDMHRYLVTEQGWLSETQFTSSIALSQAAPGPNVLFVALMGWNVGLNAGGGPQVGGVAWMLALLGMLIALVAIMLPSSVVTYTATRWAHANRQLRSVRAFKAGMAPIVIALLIATGWLLMAAHDQVAHDWRLWLLTAVTTLLVWRTRIHLLWLIGAGAVLGAMGWV